MSDPTCRAAGLGGWVRKGRPLLVLPSQPRMGPLCSPCGTQWDTYGHVAVLWGRRRDEHGHFLPIPSRMETEMQL